VLLIHILLDAFQNCFRLYMKLRSLNVIFVLIPAKKIIIHTDLFLDIDRDFLYF